SKDTPVIESKDTPVIESKDTPVIESKDTPVIESKDTPVIESKDTKSSLNISDNISKMKPSNPKTEIHISDSSSDGEETENSPRTVADTDSDKESSKSLSKMIDPFAPSS
ncbi:MAG TPA: hypothetical protein VH415_04265, partial [Nitrososphaeraceae archaeon]